MLLRPARVAVVVRCKAPAGGQPGGKTSRVFRFERLWKLVSRLVEGIRGPYPRQYQDRPVPPSPKKGQDSQASTSIPEAAEEPEAEAAKDLEVAATEKVVPDSPAK